MNQRVAFEDERSGGLVVARAILAILAVALVLATSADLPSFDPTAVIEGLVRMFLRY